MIHEEVKLQEEYDQIDNNTNDDEDLTIPKCIGKETTEGEESENTSNKNGIMIHEEVKLQEGNDAMEEVYFLRIMHLLFCVACQVVRLWFDNEFYPKQLKDTLQREEHRIKLHQVTETNKIKPLQWALMFPSKSDSQVSSSSFDIRLMLYLLNTLTKHNILNSLPNDKDTSPDADFSRIKFVRNKITQSSKMILPKKLFENYWDTLSQAILRLSAPFLKDMSDKVLKESIINLNPIRFGKNHQHLYKFVRLSNEVVAEVLESIIRQYCFENKMLIEKFLEIEKHLLFHKRFTKEKCCMCNDHGLPLDMTPVSEYHWEKLYTYQESSTHCQCRKKRKCAVRFVVRKDLRIDVTLACSLILHIPNLSMYVLKNLYPRGIDCFLEMFKHEIYHLSDTKNCEHCSDPSNLQSTISQDEWQNLYVYVNQDSLCSDNKCYCKCKAKPDIVMDAVDNTLCKIFRKVGPISYLHKNVFRIFTHFINGTLDINIQQSVSRTLDILQQLSQVLTDDSLKHKVSCIAGNYDALSSNNEDEITVTLQKWASFVLRETKLDELEAPFVSILLKEDDSTVIYEVSMSKGLSVGCRRKPKIVRHDEANFLNLVQLLYKVVSPAVKTKFDKEFKPNNLQNALMDLFKVEDDDTKNGKHKRKRHDPYLKEHWSTLFPREGCKSENFNLKLLVYLLSQTKQLKEDFENLEEIEVLRQKIVKSSSGKVSDDDFNHLRTSINEAAEKLGGVSLSKEVVYLKIT